MLRLRRAPDFCGEVVGLATFRLNKPSTILLKETNAITGIDSLLATGNGDSERLPGC
jgi:hypothetical protein